MVQTSETLITLQWDRVTSNVSFILQYASTMMTVPSPDGSGPISFIVRFLSPGTQYTFILFSGLDNVLSSGVNLTAATGKKTASRQADRHGPMLMNVDELLP